MLDQTKRLTARRVNGIRTGYWSPAKKDALIDRLADYEETGCTPEEIYAMLASKGGTWIDPETALPIFGERVLVARVKDPNELPVVEQATRGLNGWWKVYGTNAKRILAWMPMPKAPEVAK